MNKAKFAVMALALCCAILAMAEEEKKPTATVSNEEMIDILKRANVKHLNNDFDIVVDSAYVIVVGGSELVYQKGEEILLNKDGHQVYVPIEQVNTGDAVYLKNNNTSELFETTVEDLYIRTSNRAYLTKTTTTSGWYLGFAGKGTVSFGQNSFFDYGGGGQVIFGYNLDKWRFEWSLGLDIKKYCALSDKKDLHYLSPEIGTNIHRYVFSGGDFAQHRLSVGLGVYSYYRRSYFENEYGWYHNGGLGARPEVQMGYTYAPKGCSAQMDMVVFGGYEYWPGETYKTGEHHGVVGLKLACRFNLNKKIK